MFLQGNQSDSMFRQRNPPLGGVDVFIGVVRVAAAVAVVAAVVAVGGGCAVVVLVGEWGVQGGELA